jgi:hypothetical protein
MTFTFSSALANLLSINAQLPGMSPSTGGFHGSSGGGGGAVTPSFIPLAPPLVADLTAIIGYASGVVPATSSDMTTVSSGLTAIQAVTPSTAPDTGLWTTFSQTVTSAINVSAVIAATNLTQMMSRVGVSPGGNCAAPDAQLLYDFQTAYQAIASSAGGAAFTVSNVYDTATATALGVILGTPACIPTSSVLPSGTITPPTPPPTPTPTPTPVVPPVTPPSTGTTTTTIIPAPTTSPTTTLVVAGALGVASIGLLAYLLSTAGRTAAVVMENPRRRYR